jgi:hypothetical protein
MFNKILFDIAGAETKCLLGEHCVTFFDLILKKCFDTTIKLKN